MTLVVIQTDPLLTLNPITDTTLALAREAQQQGFDLFSYSPENLRYNQGKIQAMGKSFHFKNSDRQEIVEEKIVEGSLELIDLAQADFVLIRQNPPVNRAYLTKTYLLEQLPTSVKVINDPKGLRIINEKLFTLNFANFIAPTVVTTKVDDVLSFVKEHQQVIMKPINDYGGRGVIYLTCGDPNVEPLGEVYQELYPEGFILQQYLPAVKQGDKRILLLDGNPIGAFLRQPANKQIRGNLRVGGRALACELTPRDRDICKALSPELKRLGIYLAGIDVIGDYLTEVNVTSPTGFHSLKSLYSIDGAALFWRGLRG